MPLQELFHTRTIIGQCFVTSQFVMRTQGHCYCFIVSIIQLKQFVNRDCVFVAKLGYIFASQNKAILQQLTIATLFFIQLGFKRSDNVEASLFKLNVPLKKSFESERNRKDVFHKAHRYVVSSTPKRMYFLQLEQQFSSRMTLDLQTQLDVGVSLR